MDQNSLLKCEIVDGVLRISIGVELLKHAVEANPHLEHFDEDGGEFWAPEVIDVDVFAREVLTALKREEEDGTTLVHLMLDKAVDNAIESGAEGIDLAEERLQRSKKTDIG